jgi:uncharacterized protein with PQ loop repeat
VVGQESIDPAALAAVLATVLSITCLWPQLARVHRTGDVAGVSITAAALTVSSEIGWTVYLGGEGLWGAVPEGLVNIVVNALLVAAVIRAGGVSRAAFAAASLWLLALLSARIAGGPPAIAVLLALAYTIQLAPAVVTAWRTWSPSGVATATWTARWIESVLWGVYGFLRDDPPLIVFGVAGTAASSAILVRKWITRHRLPAGRLAGVDPASHPLDHAVVR